MKKIGILFDADRKNGGSFQMSINNLLAMIKNFKKLKLQIVILVDKKNLELKNLNLKYQIVKFSVSNYFFLIISQMPIIKNSFNRFNFVSSFEKKIIKNNINLLIFFSTNWKALLLKKTAFVTTVLDVCHVDFWKKKKFKEISLVVFHIREYLYKTILPLAFRVIVESKDLKFKITKLYKLRLNSIISIPNLPSYFLKKKKINKLEIERIKIKYNLPEKFYFYPAQFWEHKNHLVILEVIKNFKFNKKNINFVFCGSDKGYLANIQNKISEYGIEKNIRILNYVNEFELFVLYRLCEAMVMPSYFGPTNIPPIEAWFLKVPVLYSSLNRGHGQNACLYFNADSSTQLSRAILKLNYKKKKLVNKGIVRFKEIKIENTSGHKTLAHDIKFLNRSLKVY
jgi:glycosyltransferase involved in cell wall biosynthesis